MLISLEHRFIFIANLKTASTSIEAALQPFAQVRMLTTEWGKHQSLKHTELNYHHIFRIIPRQEFRVFAVIRDPMEWLGSLYRAHMAPYFQGTIKDTSSYSFPDFLVHWCPFYPEQMVPQTARLTDQHGQFAADFVINYHRLQEDFGAVCDMLGLPRITLRIENKSVDIHRDLPVDGMTKATIERIYRADYDLLARFTGRILSEQERRELSGEAETASPEFASPGRSSYWDAEPREVTRAEVIWAYRMLLGREPGSEDEIRHQMADRSRRDLRESFLASREFRERILGLAAPTP